MPGRTNPGVNNRFRSAGFRQNSTADPDPVEANGECDFDFNESGAWADELFMFP
jgi:hypothetical protein